MQKSRKEQGQFHNRPNIALRLAAILLMLVCLSVWMMNGLFAKYRTSDEGSDNARVMSFGALNIYEEGNFISGPAPIIPGVDMIKDVEIDFTGSEASTYVFVKVDLPAHWTKENVTSGTKVDTWFHAFEKQVSWKVAEGWTFLKTQATDQSPYIFYCQLAPNTTLLNKDFIAGTKENSDTGVVYISRYITRKEMAVTIDKSKPTIERIIKKSKRIKYVGSSRSGHWEIVEDEKLINS